MTGIFMCTSKWNSRSETMSLTHHENLIKSTQSMPIIDRSIECHQIWFPIIAIYSHNSKITSKPICWKLVDRNKISPAKIPICRLYFANNFSSSYQQVLIRNQIQLTLIMRTVQPSIFIISIINYVLAKQLKTLQINTKVRQVLNVARKKVKEDHIIIKSKESF